MVGWSWWRQQWCDSNWFQLIATIITYTIIAIIIITNIIRRFKTCRNLWLATDLKHCRAWNVVALLLVSKANKFRWRNSSSLLPSWSLREKGGVGHYKGGERLGWWFTRGEPFVLELVGMNRAGIMLLLRVLLEWDDWYIKRIKICCKRKYDWVFNKSHHHIVLVRISATCSESELEWKWDGSETGWQYLPLFLFHSSRPTSPVFQRLWLD